MAKKTSTCQTAELNNSELKSTWNFFLKLFITIIAVIAFCVGYNVLTSTITIVWVPLIWLIITTLLFVWWFLFKLLYILGFILGFWTTALIWVYSMTSWETVKETTMSVFNWTIWLKMWKWLTKNCCLKKENCGKDCSENKECKVSKEKKAKKEKSVEEAPTE